MIRVGSHWSFTTGPAPAAVAQTKTPLYLIWPNTADGVEQFTIRFAWPRWLTRPPRAPRPQEA